MDEETGTTERRLGQFKIVPASEWNIFDHWREDWPDKAHFVNQHAVTRVQYDDFKALLDKGASEQEVERYFKANPEVLSLLAFIFSTGHHAAWIYPKSQIRPAGGIGKGLIPDYLLAGANSDGVSWFVLELKAPRDKAFVRRGNHVSLSKEANRGVCQLISYMDNAARSQSYLRDELKLAGFREPLGILMIGTDEETRDPEIQAFKAAWNRTNPKVKIRSYSSLLREVATKLHSFKR